MGIFLPDRTWTATPPLTRRRFVGTYPPLITVDLNANGIASAEVFGTATQVFEITGTGIASAEAFGSHTLTFYNPSLPLFSPPQRMLGAGLHF